MNNSEVFIQFNDYYSQMMRFINAIKKLAQHSNEVSVCRKRIYYPNQLISPGYVVNSYRDVIQINCGKETVFECLPYSEPCQTARISRKKRNTNKQEMKWYHIYSKHNKSNYQTYKNYNYGKKNY